MKRRPDAQDLFAGVMFVAFAAFMLWLNTDHPIGSARRMGPGYMPMLAFGILGVLGVAIVIGGLLTGPNLIGRFAWRDMVLILLAMVVFGLTVERLGFIVSIALCVGIASLAEKVWKPLRVVGLIAFLLALCWFLFIWYLDIRIPVFPWSY
ncbi:tripartite tricarboxylate transporter TctB family protein [Elioraea rosea]|uniref:tripartite tricarboxylate transporter TctB family protein n=1 Tax=Elioraea rosea TaxID=2492390 RepID=UPI001183B41B|nr:tripartite tricarboxylate transporter TctB family protein [Elioraea rosea]